MVYDSARKVGVLFGYSSSNMSYTPHTWEWDGNNWTERSSDNGPEARQLHAMAYDSARGVTVLFGGAKPPYLTRLDDTWEWNGTDWTQRFPVHHPTEYGYMAYDSARGVSILFCRDFTTWEWNGTDWTQRTPANHPLQISDMGYDSARGVTVLFAGLTSKTWEWDGTNWTQRITANSPSERAGYQIEYDSTRGVTVLFGGTYSYDIYRYWYGDTWEYGVVSGPEPESSMTFLPLIIR
jgi:hypothetical protein